LRKLLLAIGALLWLGSVITAAPEDDFRQANNAYENKQYDDAIAAYNRVAGTGLESANLYFNLGNAYFKKGDLGHAVLYYLKAQRLNPADEDIRSNLTFARRFTSVQMEGVQLNPVQGLLASLVSRFKLATLAWLSSLVFIAFVALLIVRYGFGMVDGKLRLARMAALVLLLIVSSLTTFKYYHEYKTRHAVILAEECPVRTGPTDQSDVELQGAPGLVVEVVSESNDYYNVVFENMRRGWIKKTLVAEV
jgi:tetratricopeptide (TPR) repeat protein